MKFVIIPEIAFRAGSGFMQGCEYALQFLGNCLQSLGNIILCLLQGVGKFLLVTGEVLGKILATCGELLLVLLKGILVVASAAFR